MYTENWNIILILLILAPRLGLYRYYNMKGDYILMLIYLLLREVAIYLMATVYVVGIKILYPLIIVAAILSVLGIGYMTFAGTLAKSIISVFFMGLTNIAKQIPKFFKQIGRFFRWMRNGFSKVMPNWASTLLAVVIIIII